MPSKVYYISVRDYHCLISRKARLSRLLNELERDGLFDCAEPDRVTVIKTHFGEAGNTGYVKPPYVKMIAGRIVSKGGQAVVADSNVLYHGRRSNTKDHLLLAKEHGFTEEKIGAPVVIAEGNDGKDVGLVKLDGKYISTAKIAALFCAADAIVAISHFKGHALTSFGGAIKNLGMGCASREGKLEQHCDVSPCVTRADCTGCGNCENSCPAKAISVVDQKACIDNEKCVGCAECIVACPCGAIVVDWEQGAAAIQEKMAEYAKAVLKGKEARSLFVNFAIDVRSECDCWLKNFPKISPDIGIFASQDPVSVDKACFDRVVKSCGKDVFKEAHPDRDGFKQLIHANSIGLGNLDYELKEVK